MNQNERMLKICTRALSKCEKIAKDRRLQVTANEYRDAIKWLDQDLAHVNETQKTKHVESDVLNKQGNVDLMREALEEIANTVEEVGWYQEIAEKALATEPDADIAADAHRTLAKWLNEEIDAPIDRYALAKVLAAEPAKLVRLTEDEIERTFFAVPAFRQWAFTGPQKEFAKSIMEAMERKNGGST